MLPLMDFFKFIPSLAPLAPPLKPYFELMRSIICLSKDAPPGVSLLLGT